MKVAARAGESADCFRASLTGIYPELRRIAFSMLTRERRNHTLQPTALANETVLRLLKKEASGADRETLIAFGIREMQTILIDSGRRYRTRQRLAPAASDATPGADKMADLVHFQECVARLGEIDPRAMQIVELRFFVGLNICEVAELLRISARTVNEDWEFARHWLAAQWRL